MAPTPNRKRRLGELLLEAGLLDEPRLQAALAEQRKWGGRLGRVLIDLRFVEEQRMMEVLAQQLQLGTVNLDTATLPPKIVENLRLDLAERYGVFPVAHDPGTRTLGLATSDPTNVEAIQELEFATNSKVQPVVATASSIERAIRRYYFGENISPTSSSTAAPDAHGVVTETSYELDQLLGAELPPPRSSSPRPMSMVPPPAPLEARPDVETRLRQEIAVLKEQVEALESITSSQVRALRSLLEILIESGLITREEYLARVHRPE